MISHSLFNSLLGLTSEELLNINQIIIKHYSPSEPKLTTSPTVLTPSEILAISHEISREFNPLSSIRPDELMLWPVDPGQLHVYWNLDQVESVVKNVGEAESLTLRISQKLPVTGSGADLVPVNLDFPIIAAKFQQAIKLPPAPMPVEYSAALGQLDQSQNFTVLLTSNSILLPAVNPAFDRVYELSDASQNFANQIPGIENLAQTNSLTAMECNLI